MTKNKWQPEIGEMVVRIVPERFGTSEQSHVVEIVKIWKTGVVVTASHSNKKQYWRPERWEWADGESRYYGRGSQDGYIRPMKPGETADTIQREQNARDNAAAIKKQNRIDRDRARRDKWLVANGNAIDRALANPVKTEHGDLHVATITNWNDEPRVIVFHYYDDTWIAGRPNEPRVAVKIGDISIGIQHNADGTDTTRLGSIGGTSANGPDVKSALAKHYA